MTASWWWVVTGCTDFTDDKQMLCTQAMSKWDCGWAQGAMKQKTAKGQQYGYFIQYPKDDGTTSVYYTPSWLPITVTNPKAWAPGSAWSPTSTATRWTIDQHQLWALSTRQ